MALNRMIATTAKVISDVVMPRPSIVRYNDIAPSATALFSAPQLNRE